MTETIVQNSSGGVMYQEREGEMWVVLIATRGGRTWGLPKGLIEKGEEPLEAALREVVEEAGLRGVPVADLGHIEYWYRDSDRKCFTTSSCNTTSSSASEGTLLTTVGR